MFLIIIFLGEIAIGALFYLQEAPYQSVITKSVQATVFKKYHNNSSATTQTFDLIQEGVSLEVIKFTNFLLKIYFLVALLRRVRAFGLVKVGLQQEGPRALHPRDRYCQLAVQLRGRRRHQLWPQGLQHPSIVLQKARISVVQTSRQRRQRSKTSFARNLCPGRIRN